MTDWTKVNAIIEKMTGKPTPSKEELHQLVEQSIARIKYETETIINRESRKWFSAAAVDIAASKATGTGTATFKTIAKPN